ncbi:hypothetical protein ES703_87276 [subsurface metagenome]
MKSSSNWRQGTRKIMAGFFIARSTRRPVWCHDCNLGQHPALRGVEDNKVILYDNVAKLFGLNR